MGWLMGGWLRGIAVGGATGTLGAILISGPVSGRSKIARPSWSGGADRTVKILRSGKPPGQNGRAISPRLGNLWRLN
jgi:hypothetical protein